MFFNVGVEIGQLLFIAAVFAATRLLFLLAKASQLDLRRAAIVPAYLIGGIASYWVIERISNFWLA